MKILIVTPLYPPDIQEPAPYVKELATRLLPTHDVTILAYNHIPENIAGVTIVPIEKSAHVLTRLTRFYRALRRLAPHHDVVYVQNGPSVEVPVLAYIMSTAHPPRSFLRLGDHVPLKEHKGTSGAYITHMLMKRVLGTFSHEDTSELCEYPSTIIPRPLERPEILPFTNRDEGAISAYEASWNEHITHLNHAFSP